MPLRNRRNDRGGDRLPKRRRGSIAREIAVLRRTFTTLDQLLARLGPILAAAWAHSSRTPEKGRRRRLRLSAKRRATLKLQGRYMGYMRQLKAAQKSRVRKAREVRGVKAAIILAKSLASR